MMLLKGLENYLAQQNGVCNIQTRDAQPVQKESVIHWQETTGLTLPSDLRNLYTSYGGLSLSWQYSCYKTTEDVGCIEVLPLSELTIIDSNSLSEEEQHHKDILPFGSDTTLVIFESAKYIEQSDTPQPVFDGIWVIDLGLDIHRLSDDFSSYLRLAIVHLGLPEWQNLLLQNQICSRNIIWFELFLPKRLELDLYGESKEQSSLFEPSMQLIDLSHIQ